MIRVLVVAQVRLYREGIAQFLQSHPGISVTGIANGVVEAARLVSGDQSHVVLIDVSRSGSLAAVRSLARLMPTAKIVVLGIREDESEIVACAEAGMTGYVSRDGSLHDLVEAIEAVTRGELACTPTIAAMLLRRVGRAREVTRAQPNGKLTRREREIALLVGEGLGNKQIATRLHVALPTVKNHVHSILAKLGVSSRSQVAVWATSGGSVDPSSKASESEMAVSRS